MNAVLEGTTVELEQARTDEKGAAAEVTVNADRDFRELARRCRERLAQRATTTDCPPGHWLG